MASIISAGTTSGTALNMAGDTSGVLQLATNGTTTAITIDASQRAAFVAGTAALPAITTTGDTNTGMWFPAADTIAFSEGGVEAMRIDSSGNVLIGTTSSPNIAGVNSNSAIVNAVTNANWALAVQNTAASGGARGIVVNYSGQTPNSTTSEALFFYDSTGTKFGLRSNGGIANYSANNVNLSDQREKTNIELAGSYLDKVCAIPVKTFNYIDQNMEEDGGLTLGVIAQDVQAVAPELVTESNWGTEEEPKQRLSIYQTDLQYALMKCIQEQQTIINDLKARITALEGAK